MKFENVHIFNFENALRGMRNPLESYHLSDSEFGVARSQVVDEISQSVMSKWKENNFDNRNYQESIFQDGLLEVDTSNNDVLEHYAFIGPNDMKLAKRLINGGSEHRKFLRHIFISMDISAPEYWWKEMVTYMVGVSSANSTSTMHRVLKKPIGLSLFETDDMEEFEIKPLEATLEQCELLREKYLETEDKKYWKALIRLLPMSWTYKRTWSANYEVLRNIYHQRREHKLSEWHQFCDFIEKLPYAKDFIVG